MTGEDTNDDGATRDGYEPLADAPESDELLDAEEDSHRGAFGEFGGEQGAFIDRTFRERIVLVGVTRNGGDPDQTEADLDELELLVDTAGADVVARLDQRRDRPDPATFIGKGKVEELRVTAEALDCDTVVFDDELSPAQQNNLEKLLKRSAIDRTAVILDIFAQNASSQEGKSQVELAQLRYRLPRLRGRGTSMSQQAGGIGTRGPGETQLETDRRRILRRIHKLEADLRGVARHRSTQRKQRQRSRAQHVVIVGYTNAGKSTLLNRLTDAGVLVEDRLFATLDATTRRLQLPGGEAVLMTDTVGFVRKLPHQLVEAFRSTLDVATDADLLVHVVDGAAADPQAQMDAVRDVLAEIGAERVPELICFNKSDVSLEVKRLVDRHPGSVGISALTGQGVDDMLTAIGDRLRVLTAVVELFVPYARGEILAEIHREGEVLSESAEDDGMRLRARLDDTAQSKLGPFVVGDAAHQ